MAMYDVSIPVHHGMAVWENNSEKQPIFNRITEEHITETKMELNLHTGTHIDAPLHMINDGETFETIPLHDLIGSVKVFDLTHVKDGISKSDLEHLDIQSGDFVLFKTKNSFEKEFNFDFIYLTHDGAQYLIQCGIKGVGIDTLGIERSQTGNPTHRDLFKQKIIILEGLRLKDVKPDSYFMVAAPLNLIGTEASPARVILFDERPF